MLAAWFSTWLYWICCVGSGFWAFLFFLTGLFKPCLLWLLAWKTVFSPLCLYWAFGTLKPRSQSRSHQHHGLFEYLYGHNLTILCKSLLYTNSAASLQFGIAQRLFLKAGFCSQFSKDKTRFDYRPPLTKEMPTLLSCRVLISTSILPFSPWQAFCSS